MNWTPFSEDISVKLISTVVEEVEEPIIEEVSYILCVFQSENYSYMIEKIFKFEIRILTNFSAKIRT